MAQTHWRKLTNPNYFGSWDFQPNEEKILTIASVACETVDGADGKKEDCPVVHFVEKNVKPLVLNHTNGKTISKVLGTPIIEFWEGKRIALNVQKVKAFGEVVDAVRVVNKTVSQRSTSSDEPVKYCNDCQREIIDKDGFPAKTIIAGSLKRYGVALCMACATKRKTDLDAEAKLKEYTPSELPDEDITHQETGELLKFEGTSENQEEKS